MNTFLHILILCFNTLVKYCLFVPYFNNTKYARYLFFTNSHKIKKNKLIFECKIHHNFITLKKKFYTNY